MILGITASVLLVVAGYFPVRLVTGTRYAAVVAAPLMTALLVSLFGIACLVLRCSIGFAVAAVVVVSVVSAVLVRRRTFGVPRPVADSPMLLAIALGAVVPLATVVRAPIAWDARSIWWFHAKWWAEGGGAVLDAMRTPAFVFSHGDYPPLASATNGALWWLLGSRSLKEAQVVTAVLGLSAITMLGFAVWRLFVGNLSRVVVTLGAALLVLACYEIAGVDAATNGYVDFLWAACFAAAAVLLVASPLSDETLRWGALLLAVAALTKNEALIAALLLGGIGVVRARLRLQWIAVLAVALAPGVAWLALTKLAHVPADKWRFSALFHRDPVVTDRIVPTLHWLWRDLNVVVLTAAVVSLLGYFFLRDARRSITGSWFPWMWLAWVALMGPLVLAYVVTTDDLWWRLYTSAERTTIAPNLLLLPEIAIWTLVAISAVLRPPAREIGATPADDRLSAGVPVAR